MNAQNIELQREIVLEADRQLANLSKEKGMNNVKRKKVEINTT